MKWKRIIWYFAFCIAGGHLLGIIDTFLTILSIKLESAGGFSLLKLIIDFLVRILKLIVYGTGEIFKPIFNALDSIAELYANVIDICISFLAPSLGMEDAGFLRIYTTIAIFSYTIWLSLISILILAARKIRTFEKLKNKKLVLQKTKKLGVIILVVIAVVVIIDVIIENVIKTKEEGGLKRNESNVAVVESVKARIGVQLPQDVLVVEAKRGKSSILYQWVLFSTNKFEPPDEKIEINKEFYSNYVEFLNDLTGIKLNIKPEKVFLIVWTGKGSWFRGWLLVSKSGNYAVIEELEY